MIPMQAGTMVMHLKATDLPQYEHRSHANVLVSVVDIMPSLHGLAHFSLHAKHIFRRSMCDHRIAFSSKKPSERAASMQIIALFVERGGERATKHNAAGGGNDDYKLEIKACVVFGRSPQGMQGIFKQSVNNR